jgi:hypothetical protein
MVFALNVERHHTPTARRSASDARRRKDKVIVHALYLPFAMAVNE